MLIKTTSGLEVGGAITANKLCDAISYVPAGASIEVTFTFNACLNAGNYFLNAGVQGDIDGEDTYLHRVLDICMFKIMPGSNNFSTGIVNFQAGLPIISINEKS